MVDFLVDTGADATVLHPQDSLRLLLAEEIQALPYPVPFGGAGAGVLHHPTMAILAFLDEDRGIRTVRLPIYVAEVSPSNVDLESLLGRDVLRHFPMYFDQRRGHLTLG